MVCNTADSLNQIESLYQGLSLSPDELRNRTLIPHPYPDRLHTSVSKQIYVIFVNVTDFARIFQTDTPFTCFLVCLASLYPTKIYRAQAPQSRGSVPLTIAFFDAILLKNVGDSPDSVRFCRNFEPFCLLPSLNFS